MYRLHAALAGAALTFGALTGAFAQCPASVPVEGAPPPGPLPVFPPTTGGMPMSAPRRSIRTRRTIIAFINNGGRRTLHPDFGGTVSRDSDAVYGFPYVIVDDMQPKVSVKFQYATRATA
jgi:hypothetical protein